MEPISRKELQEAKAVEDAAKFDRFVRAEEIKGQLWAERVRTAVCHAATDGKMEFDAEVNDLSTIAFAYAVRMIEVFFPDCDITMHSYTDLAQAKTIKISWD
jgi:hypothetical protein